jgi:DNA-binding NarL/FixJ family response regulator
MKERVTVLIIAKPGQVRDGLRALLHAIPGVDVVDQPCDGMLNAGLLAEYNPALIREKG